MTLPRQDGAAAPGQVTPRSDNAPWQGRVIEGSTEQDSADSAASVSLCRQRDDAKRLAGLRARFALRGGHVVHELPEGGFLVCWRGISRECADFEALEAHARRVGALR